jgi:hypothetical protein
MVVAASVGEDASGTGARRGGVAGLGAGAVSVSAAGRERGPDGREFLAWMTMTATTAATARPPRTTRMRVVASMKCGK